MKSDGWGKNWAGDKPGDKPHLSTKPHPGENKPHPAEWDPYGTLRRQKVGWGWGKKLGDSTVGAAWMVAGDVEGRVVSVRLSADSRQQPGEEDREDEDEDGDGECPGREGGGDEDGGFGRRAHAGAFEC